MKKKSSCHNTRLWEEQKKQQRKNATSYQERTGVERKSFDRKQDGYVYNVSLKNVPFSLLVSIIWFVVWCSPKTYFFSIFLTHSFTHSNSFVRLLSQFAGKIDLFYFHLVTLFRLHFDYKTIRINILWTVWGAVHKYRVWLTLVVCFQMFDFVQYLFVHGANLTLVSLSLTLFSSLAAIEVFEVWFQFHCFGFFHFYHD